MALWQLWTCDPRWPKMTQDDPRWQKKRTQDDSTLWMSQKVPLLDSKPVEGENSEKKTSTFWVENGRTRFNIFRNRFNVVQPSSGSWSMKCRCLQSPWLGCETWSYMVKSSKEHCERNMKCLHCKWHWTKQNQNMSATCIILYELVKFETCPLQPSNCKVKNSCWTRKLGSCAPPERLGSWVSGLNELQYVSICFNYLRSGSFEYVWTGSIQIEFNNLLHLTKHAFNAMHINTFLQETRKHLQTMCMCLSSWHSRLGSRMTYIFDNIMIANDCWWAAVGND